MARLVLLSEGLTGRTHELKVERTTLGRVADNTFEIPEASVSSHHCEILLRGNDVIVKDLGSTNGTFINGEKITEATLKPGQILRCGMIEMRLESGEGPISGAKKKMEHTMVIPQGVKLDELEGTRPIHPDTKTTFRKKRNTATTIFIIGAFVVAVVLIALLVMIVMKK
jgi:pSer/pThr/pTyr-binding forkhead associated (FHA) protein